MNLFKILLQPLSLIVCAVSLTAADLLVEAESFAERGGWKLDTQFITEMGSPHLLAHGLGTPVKDAATEVTFPATGTYRVFARTKDWVARWKAPGQPGRFQESFRVYGRGGKPCPECGRAIRRIVVGQRGTHLCTRCQVAPRPV